MGLALVQSYRLFRLFIRCAHCLHDSVLDLPVPLHPDAPQTAGELECSGALSGVPFICQRCEGTSGRLTGISGGQIV